MVNMIYTLVESCLSNSINSSENFSWQLLEIALSLNTGLAYAGFSHFMPIHKLKYLRQVLDNTWLAGLTEPSHVLFSVALWRTRDGHVSKTICHFKRPKKTLICHFDYKYFMFTDSLNFMCERLYCIFGDVIACDNITLFINNNQHAACLKLLRLAEKFS